MYIEDYCHLINGGLVLKDKFSSFTRENILTDNTIMNQQLDMLDHSRTAVFPLIISGEKGCGKDMIAKYACQMSDRSGENFLKINCAYMTDEHISRELFGSKTNSFSSLLRRACGGTLYIENAHLLSVQMQSRLNDYLSSDEGQEANIRLFTGTDNTEEYESLLIDSLIYNFSAKIFDIPPLRQRPEDILLLSMQQLSQIKQEYQIERILSPNVMEAILSYEWPGNIRQLINTIDRMAFFSNSTLIDSVSVLHNSLSSTSRFYEPKQSPVISLKDKSLKELTLEYEVMVINQYIEEYGSLRKAAVALKTSPSVLSSKITKFNKSGY